MVRDSSTLLPDGAATPPARREPTTLERLGWGPLFAQQLDAQALTQTPPVRVVAMPSNAPPPNTKPAGWNVTANAPASKPVRPPIATPFSTAGIGSLRCAKPASGRAPNGVPSRATMWMCRSSIRARSNSSPIALAEATLGSKN